MGYTDFPAYSWILQRPCWIQRKPSVGGELVSPQQGVGRQAADLQHGSDEQVATTKSNRYSYGRRLPGLRFRASLTKAN
jgi:hypothetical protein